MAIPVILWAASGILHPFMANWLKPEIPHKFFPPKAHTIDVTEAKRPSEIFADLDAVHQLKVFEVAGALHYVAYTKDQRAHYRHALTGEALADGERVHAIELAAAFLDQEVTASAQVERYDSFSAQYTPINRLLPAYRVDFGRGDSLQAVVHPRTGKLAAYDDSPRRAMRVAFNWFHTWGFLGPHDSVFRIAVVTVLSLLSLSVAISGLLTLIMTRGKRTPASPRSGSARRRTHRILGGSVAVFYFLFGVSGLAHAAVKFRGDDSTQWVSDQAVETGKLARFPVVKGERFSGLSLAVVDGQPYWRTVLVGEGRARPIEYRHTQTGEILLDGDKTYARGLAAEFSGMPSEKAGEAEQITAFREDYGFIFRRLPVWRIHYPGQQFWQYTVDTADAHMSMRTDTAGLAESLLFVNFHKFHFIDPISKELRDYVSVAASLSLVVLVVSGLMIRRRRRA